VASAAGAKTILEANRNWFQKGLTFLGENPEKALVLLGRKAYLFFSPGEPGGDFPFGFEKQLIQPLRWMCVATFTLFALLAAWGGPAFRRTGAPIELFGGAFLITFATCFIFYVNGRYRVPVWPLLLVPSTLGAARLWQESRAKEWRRSVPNLLLAGLCSLLLWSGAKNVVTKPMELTGWHNVARAYEHVNDWDQAILNYEKVLKIYPIQRHTLEHLSRIYLRRRQLGKAETTLRILLRYHQDSHIGHNSYSELFLRKRDWQGARGAARRALRLRPNWHPALANYGEASFRLRQLGEACPSIQEVIESYPDRRDLREMLNVCKHSAWKALR
jgi:tetratricopeptide (TPR) repeat protein